MLCEISYLLVVSGAIVHGVLRVYLLVSGSYAVIVAVSPAPVPETIVTCLPTSVIALGFVGWPWSERYTMYWVPVATPSTPFTRNVLGAASRSVVGFQWYVEPTLTT